MSSSAKTIVPYVVAVVLAVVMAFLIGWVVRLEKELHTVPDPVTVTDTIVDWQYDTVFQYTTKIVKLPVHDTTTCIDSLWTVDSVYVEVPMYCYKYDTILADTHSTTRLHASLTGYDVRVDTLAVSTTITPIVIKETIPWYKRFRPSVGVGVGTTFKGQATVGAYVGVGYLF